MPLSCANIIRLEVHVLFKAGARDENNAGGCGELFRRVIVPLAYEACGSWGQHAMDFFNFVKRCAGSEGTRAAELYHWSAMTFGGHWRRRMAVEIGRGRVACLRRSGDRGFEGNSSSEAETAFDSM